MRRSSSPRLESLVFEIGGDANKSFTETYRLHPISVGFMMMIQPGP